MKELLLQIKQRTEKLLEETEKLEDLEFQYHTLCCLSEYGTVQDQKDLVEFLKLKLKTSVDLLGASDEFN